MSVPPIDLSNKLRPQIIQKHLTGPAWEQIGEVRNIKLSELEIPETSNALSFDWDSQVGRLSQSGLTTVTIISLVLIGLGLISGRRKIVGFFAPKKGMVMRGKMDSSVVEEEIPMGAASDVDEAERVSQQDMGKGTQKPRPFGLYFPSANSSIMEG